MHFGPLVRIPISSKRLWKAQNELLAVFAAKYEVQHSGKVRVWVFPDVGSGSGEMYQWIKPWASMCKWERNLGLFLVKVIIFFHDLLHQPFDKPDKWRVPHALLRRQQLHHFYKKLGSWRSIVYVRVHDKYWWKYFAFCCYPRTDWRYSDIVCLKKSLSGYWGCLL